MNPYVFIVVSIVFLSLLYFMNGGLNGSILPLFLVYLVIFIFITKIKFHPLILVVTSLDLVCLIILESVFVEDLIIQYADTKAREVDLVFGYVASLVLIYLLVSYFKRIITSKNNELDRLNKSKDMLFSIIAHDLSSPLKNILGFTTIMADKSQKLTYDEFQNFSEITNIETQRSLELLESLLEWGELLKNKVQINLQVVNLHEIIKKVLVFFKQKYTEKGIDISIQIPKETIILVDIDMLSTIIRNLVSNAIKFTSQGGEIILSVEELSRKYITIIVKDNGVGMHKEMLDKLFCKEVNTNRKGTAGEASSGLGLIIVKELLEKLGSELIIDSEINHGSTFKFTVQRP